jgi:hypothetical protein
MTRNMSFPAGGMACCGRVRAVRVPGRAYKLVSGGHVVS